MAAFKTLEPPDLPYNWKDLSIVTLAIAVKPLGLVMPTMAHYSITVCQQCINGLICL